jgi:signal transduction histidine kinase/BarA-like signal transduction histidine kinase
MYNYKGHKTSKRRIKLIHHVSLICMMLSLLFAVATFYIKGYGLSYFLVGTSAIFYFTSKIAIRKPTQARLLFIITFNVSVTIAASYLGKNSSIEFFLMYALTLAFVLYSYRREKELVFLFCLLPFTLWTILYFTDFSIINSTAIDPEIIQNFIYPLSITFTLLLIAFQLSYYSYINAGFNNNVHNKKQEAIDVSNAKSNFLSTMSHEIRTPLNAVIGLSHILGDNNPRKDQKENIEALNYSGKILLNLLNNVLDLSKMQSSQIELDNIPTDLTSAFTQIKKIHETSCIRKGITMNLFIDNDLPVVWLDIVRFNQVINNLVTNAIKFTEKGSVTLRIKKIKSEGDQIKILTEIIDTGIGIPKDKQDTIWEAFTQASSTTNRLYGGTGLGLPIVKNIVEAMDAEIKIDSEEGKGSRFYFEVDLKIASEKDCIDSNFKEDYNFEGKKVLLVEDNEINIMVGKQILEKTKLQVDVAYNGLEAVKMTKENDYDIVLMDIQMPVMDGYTSALEIRKFNSKIPILALSASVFMEVKDKIFESGMDGFIFKPFDPEDLLQQINTQIHKNQP